MLFFRKYVTWAKASILESAGSIPLLWQRGCEPGSMLRSKATRILLSSLPLPMFYYRLVCFLSMKNLFFYLPIYYTLSKCSVINHLIFSFLFFYPLPQNPRRVVALLIWINQFSRDKKIGIAAAHFQGERDVGPLKIPSMWYYLVWLFLGRSGKFPIMIFAFAFNIHSYDWHSLIAESNFHDN